MATPDLDQLRSRGRAYLRQAARLDCAGIAERQDPPWTNIAFGAAGIAYALWRAAGPGRRHRLDQADRILRDAVEAARRDRWPEPRHAQRRGLGPGLYYGTPGIGVVRILVAKAREDEATCAREVVAFVDACHASVRRDELMTGLAGLLNGARITYASTRDPRLHDVAAMLASKLERRLAKHAKQGTRGSILVGFAHGPPGAVHALVAWAHDTERPLSAATQSALDVLAARAHKGELCAPGIPPFMQRSWCNGGAGHVLLWAKAFEHTGDARYLALAREAARSLLTALRGAGADLCCGFGGRAFALLAMDRIDPGKKWASRARAMAARAMHAAEAESGPWPNGLYKGYPGLTCLLDDLTAPSRAQRGFPLVEC